MQAEVAGSDGSRGQTERKTFRISTDEEIAAREADLDRANFYTSLGALLACLLYTSPSPRDRQKSRMPSSA